MNLSNYKYWVYQPPADNSKCEKCGKDLDTVGLNRTYPPKRDDMGRAICPHCGHTQCTDSAMATIQWSDGNQYKDRGGFDD